MNYAKKKNAEITKIISSTANPIDNDNYIADGLILYVDAINNTGCGHSDTATVWRDLSDSGNDGTLINFSDSSDGRGWGNNYLDFGTDKISLPYVNFNSCYFPITSSFHAYTVEVTYKYERPFVHRAPYDWFCPIATESYGSTVFGFLMQGNKITTRKEIITYTFDETKINTNFTVTQIGNGINTSLFVDGERKGVTPINGNGVLSFIAIGKMFNYGFSNPIYSVRIYDRTLFPSEIRHNYLVDKARFAI